MPKDHAPRSPRAPPRCSKCPGRPLRSQCPHTPTGREFISQQKALAAQIHELVTDVTPEILSTPTDLLSTLHPSGSTVTPPRVPPTISLTRDVPGPDAGAAVDPAFAIDPILLNMSITQTPQHVIVPASPVSAPTISQGANNDNIGSGDNAEMGNNGGMDSDTGTDDDMDTDDDADTDDDLGDIEEIASVLTLVSTPTSNPVTKKPDYGTVEGVKRGNENIDISRKKELPKPFSQSKLSAKRFNHVMKDLVIRCERLSVQTGCWLYISAQHTTANQGFFNYASPRLRLEAKPQLIGIQNHFNALFSSLLHARRLEAVELSVKLQKAEEKRELVEKQLATQETMMAEKDAYIARLESQILSQNK